MMRKAKVYDANGIFLRELQDGEIAKDGECVRFNMMAMDSLEPTQRLVVQDSLTPASPRHAPGYVADADHSGRAERFFDNKKRLSDAWKDTPSAGAEQTKPMAAPQPQVTQDADAAYDRHCVALEKAYLTAGA